MPDPKNRRPAADDAPIPGWAEQLARDVNELSRTLARGNRGERIKLLIDALAEHYRTVGEPEPGVLRRAREIWAGRFGTGEDTQPSTETKE